jgi:hypothetical protein
MIEVVSMRRRKIVYISWYRQQRLELYGKEKGFDGYCSFAWLIDRLLDEHFDRGGFNAENKR